MLSAPPKGCSNPDCKCSRDKQSRCAGNKNKDLWRADVLIDPFRPGVLERLGLGPDVLLKSNPGLVIVRLTGFRREGGCTGLYESSTILTSSLAGPYSKMAGHDLNYIALSGVLSEFDALTLFQASFDGRHGQVCSVARTRSLTFPPISSVSALV